MKSRSSSEHIRSSRSSEQISDIFADSQHASPPSHTSIERHEEEQIDEQAPPIIRTRMPLKGKILLPDVTSYQLFGVFPWALLFHLILVLLDSLWLFRLNTISSDYLRRQEILWFTRFMDHDMEINDLVIVQERMLSSISEMTELVQTNVDWIRKLQQTEDAKEDLDDGQWSNQYEQFKQYCEDYERIKAKFGDTEGLEESDDESSDPDNFLSTYAPIKIDCNQLNGVSADTVKIPVTITIEFNTGITNEEMADVLKNYEDILVMNQGGLAMLEVFVDKFWAENPQLDYGLFGSNADLKQVLLVARNIVVAYNVVSILPPALADNFYFRKYLWKISQVFTIGERSQVLVSMKFSNDGIGKALTPKGEEIFWFNLTILVFAFCQLVQQIANIVYTGSKLERAYEHMTWQVHQDLRKKLTQTLDQKVDKADVDNQSEVGLIQTGKDSLVQEGKWKKAELLASGLQASHEEQKKKIAELATSEIMKSMAKKEQMGANKLTQISRMNSSYKITTLEAAKRGKQKSEKDLLKGFKAKPSPEKRRLDNDGNNFNSAYNNSPNNDDLASDVDSLEGDNQLLRKESVSSYRPSIVVEEEKKAEGRELATEEKIVKGQSAFYDSLRVMTLPANQESSLRRKRTQRLSKTSEDLASSGQRRPRTNARSSEAKTTPLEASKSEAVQPFFEQKNLNLRLAVDSTVLFLSNIGQIRNIQFMVKTRLVSSWNLVIIATSLIHVQITFSNLSLSNKDLAHQCKMLGIATLLSWFSLNAHLVTYKKMAFLPNTFIISSKAVLNGLIGILPFVIGIGIFTCAQLCTYYRFKDVAAVLFTMFYVMNGDTVFDTFYGAFQINALFATIWAFFWVWFSINVVLNITLAQLEQSFFEAKYVDRFEWLMKPIPDPILGEKGSIEEIQKKSLTPPQALYNILKRQKVHKMLKPVEEQEIPKDVNNPFTSAKHYHSLTEFIQVQEYYEEYKLISSKKQLMAILSVEELQWLTQSMNVRMTQQLNISLLLSELITFKIFFLTARIDTMITHIDKLVIIRSFNNHIRFKLHNRRVERHRRLTEIRASKTTYEGETVREPAIKGVETFNMLQDHITALRDEALEFEKELMADEGE